MGDNITSKLILGFITLLLGAVLIGVIATQQLAVTDKSVVTSETHNVLPTILTGRNETSVNESIVYTITEAPTSWKVDDCPITNFVLANSSGSAFTDTTDYVFTEAAGTFTLVNSATTIATLPVADNNTVASYTYCGDDYMNLSWGRTGINLVAGFFAIAMLMTALGIFYSVAKDTGLM